jgi:hypothetical protein
MGGLIDTRNGLQTSMLKAYAAMAFIFVLGVIVGALAYGPPRHCVLNEKECRKTRARLNMWAKRYKRKVDELSNDTK